MKHRNSDGMGVNKELREQWVQEPSELLEGPQKHAPKEIFHFC